MIELKLSEFRLFKPTEPQPIKLSRVESLKRRLTRIEHYHDLLLKEASRNFNLITKVHQSRLLITRIQQQLNNIYNYERIREIEGAN